MSATDLQWANQYYTEPDLVRYAGLLLNLAKHTRSLQDKKHVGRLLGAAMRKEPERIQEAWQGCLRQIPHTDFKWGILYGLWYSGTEQGRTVLNRVAGATRATAHDRCTAKLRLRKPPPRDPMQKPLSKECVIDELWDNFLMTGDTCYLQRIGLAAKYRTPEQLRKAHIDTPPDSTLAITQSVAIKAAQLLLTESYQHRPVAEVFQSLYMKPIEETDPTNQEKKLRGRAVARATQ